MDVDLLERMIHDDAVQHEITYRLNETITGARWLLDAPAGAASDQFWPTSPRYWDWHDNIGFDFQLEDDVEHRIRALSEMRDWKMIFHRIGELLTSRSEKDYDCDHLS